MGIAIPQVATEDRASGAQVIDGSLRFDSRTSQSLTRTPGSAGNRKTWTYSAWVKTIPSALSAANHKNLFSVDSGSASDSERMHLFLGNASDKIQHDLHGSSPRVSSSVYRDIDGWYHVVVKFDSTQAVARGQIAWYINGEQVVNWDTESALTQNGDYAVNGAYLHRIGANNAAGPGQFWDGRMSQVYMVDGLALGPEYFGYTDGLTGTWRPKKFKAEGTTINNGTVWSNGTVNGTPYSGSTTWDKAFDGNLTGTGAAGGVNTANEFNLALPNIDITNKNVTIYANSNSADVWLNGKQMFMTNGIVYSGSVYQKSFTSSDIGSTTLTQIGLDAGLTVYGVSIDGVILINSTTQNLAFGTNGFYLPMDGNSPIGEDKSGRGNNWTPVNFGGSIALPKATGAKPILNTTAGMVARPGVFGSEENKFYTVTTANGSVYQFDITSGNNPSLSFIRGATYRFDYTSHSSHPLRFSSTNPDSSTSAYTDGTNTSVSNVITITVPHNAPDTLYYYCTAHASGMNGSISVTTDETKADPYAWKCVLAVPLVSGIDDVSADINATTIKKAATNYGSADSSAVSNFYGSSRKFDGSNDNINYAANADLGFDGDFTIECFCTPGTTGNDSNAVIASKAYYNANYNWYLKFNDQSGGKMTWYSYNGQGGGENLNVTNLGTTDANRIHHIAVTRESNVMRLYLDGVKVGNATFSRNYNDGATNGLTLARQPSGNSANSAYGWYDGYMSDLRIYKGVAKYNGATTGVQYFIPASTNPDILPDTPSGVSGGSKLTKITDGAVVFDGTTDDINVPSHSDITFGTGVFTIDCFVYFNSFDDTYPTIMSKYTNSISWILRAKNTGKIVWYTTNGGGTNNESSTSPILLKKWHHIAVVREGTGSNQLKVYVDGTVAITMTDANDYNDSNVLCIGAQQAGGGNTINGYISNVRLVKGTAVYTSEFTPPFRTLTNVTNTKLLCCQSPTSATTAAVIPTGSITANGNAVATTFNPLTTDIDAVRGQTTRYCTLNPLSTAVAVLSNGNLLYGGGSGQHCVGSTFAVASGKWYWESKVEPGGTYYYTGIADVSTNYTTNWCGSNSGWSVSVNTSGNICYNNAENHGSIGGSASGGQVWGWALDMDAGTFKVYIDGMPKYSGNSIIPSDTNLFGRTVTPATGHNSGKHLTFNFGQKPFKFPPPAGFQSLNAASARSDNMIASSDQFVEATIWTGDGVNGRLIQTTSKPDFVWLKNRATAGRSYYLYDSVRGFGANKELVSNSTDEEGSNNHLTQNHGYVSGVTAAGFTLASGATNSTYTNDSGNTYVAWTWKAGGNKNTFNVDDVGYANASDIGMSVGALNNTINKTQLWSGLFTLSAGSFDQAITQAFNGAISPSTRARTGDNQVTITMTLSTPVTVSSQVKVFAQDGYTSNCTITVGGTTHTSLAAPVHTFNVSGSLTLMTLVTTSGSGRTYFEGMEIDGKLLVDSNVSINVPSYAATGASVGTKQGFSIVKWTHSNGTAGTIPHGLSKAPTFVIYKSIDNVKRWTVGHESVGWTQALVLDSSGGSLSADGAYWSNTAPTSSVFTIGDTGQIGNGATIAYCWHDLPGMFKTGKYVNNASADGPFIELGFKPAIVLLKCTSSGTNWRIADNVRDPFNNGSSTKWLRPSSSDTEVSERAIDFVSNGFKIRSTSGGDINQSSNAGTITYIYAAWAEASVSNLFGAQSTGQ